MWRIAHSSLCTGLAELETSWSIDDVADAHDALDVFEELDAKCQH